MAFCAIGRGVVLDAGGAAPRAVCGVVLLSRSAHPSSIKKYVKNISYHETPSRTVFIRNPIGLRCRNTKPHRYTIIVSFPLKSRDKSGMTPTCRRNYDNHTCDHIWKSSEISVRRVKFQIVALVVTNYYCHQVVSTQVSRTYHNTRLRFCPSGCAFGSRCHRPGFEPHRRRHSGEK